MPIARSSWCKRILPRCPGFSRWQRRLGVERLENRIVFAGDTLGNAPAPSFLTWPGATVQTAQASGFLAKPNEVDLYKVSLQPGDRVTASVSAQASGGTLQSLLRVFDGNGDPVALDDQEGGDPRLTFQADPTDRGGVYYVGVSSDGNDRYDPTTVNSGRGGTTKGLYTLNLSLTPAAPLQADLTGASFRLTSGATAAYGDTIAGSFTIDNRGGAASGNFTVQIVLSTGTRFDGFDPSLKLPIVLVSGPPAELAAGSAYTNQFTATLPGAAPANFPVSGPLYIGLLITTGNPATDSGKYDKSGVHRGEDFENRTIVTPAPAGTTDLTSVDPTLNTRVDGMLSGPGQVHVYTFTITSATGTGDLTASVAATGGTLVPRLTLSASTGQVLVTTDSGTMMQNLAPGTYILAVSVQVGAGEYRLTTEFVQGGLPPNPIVVANSADGTESPTVAVADLNGDGKPDIVVANPGDNTVSVLLGNGDGTFQSQQTYPVGRFPDAVAVADLNGDGKPDIVVANLTDNTVSVLLGNGDGAFQSQQTFLVGSNAGAVAVADLNGDGKPDIVVANPGDNTVSVLLGNGDGSFQSQQTFPIGSNAGAVAVADLNGDGKPDLVVANLNDNTVSVLLGNGDGTFQSQQTFPVGSTPFAVTVADLNGDGKPDLVVANDGSRTVSVLLGNGDGSFQTQQTFPAGYSPDMVAVADLNGDGKPDLVVANPFSNTVNVLLGNGDGTFQTQQIFPVGSDPTAVAVADLNGDGKPDLVVANTGNKAVSVLLGNGDGAFQSQQTFLVGSNAGAVAVADLNGDGKPDIVVANPADNTVSVLLGNSDGTFQTQQIFHTGSDPTAVAVADVNGDGKPDIVVSNQLSNTVSVLLGNGDGTFQPQQTFPVGRSPDAVAVADLNGDGKPDIVVANLTDSTVGVLLGNGDGTFQPQQTFYVGSGAVALAVADVNGDGKPDIVVANRNSGTVGVLLGNGDGTFQPQQTFPVGRSPDAVAVADLNGDGKPDIVVANRNSASVSVLLGNGDGTFRSQQTFPVGGLPLAVAVADVNGDGKPDLVVANRNSASVSVLLGKGDGAFQFQQAIPIGFIPYTLAVADLNGDGRPDIVVANRGDGTVSVLLNNGNGTFSPSTPTTGVSLRNTPYLADLNGNGIPDSVILDSSGDILFRKGLPGADDSFAPPRILNSGRPARDLAVVRTGTGWAVAAADASFDPSLSSANHFVYTVSLYTAAADDSFTRTTAFTTTLLPTRIAAADLTGDGLDDIVVADSLDNSIQVAFQQPDGSFRSPLTLSTGEAPSDISLVDLNGDGLLDIVVSNQASGEVSVFLNTGNGSFAPEERFRAGTGLFGLDATSPKSVVASPEKSVSLAAGNFTSNGRNDLVVVNQGADSFSVLANDGNGGFANPQADLTTSTSDGLALNNQAGPVVAGYFNGLGAPLDLAILMEDTDQVWIYTGDGQGRFTHTFSIAAGDQPTGLNTVVNPDTGFEDLLVGNVFGDVLRLQGNGDGTFQTPTGNQAPLAVYTIGGQTQVLLGNQAQNHVVVETALPGSTTFVPTQTVVSAAPTTPFAPGDVQWYPLDPAPFAPRRTPEAVVVASGSNSVLTYRLDPTTGRYVQTNDIPVGDDPVSVTIATLPGESAPDMFVANYGSNDVSVILGSIVNGQWVGTPGPRLKSGGFGPVSAFPVSNSSSLGGADLAVVNQDGTASILPGRGQGFFNDANPQSVTLSAAPVQAATVVPGSPGIAITTDGQLLQFDPNNLAAGATAAFSPTAPVTAAAVVPNSNEVVVAEADGTVEELATAAAGQLQPVAVATPLDGVPAAPSAVQVVNSAEGQQVLVTSEGLDTVFLFTLLSPNLSTPPESNPSAPPPSNPSTLVGSNPPTVPGPNPPTTPQPNPSATSGLNPSTIPGQNPPSPQEAKPGSVANVTTTTEAPFVLVVTLVADTLSGAISGNSPALLLSTSPQTPVTGLLAPVGTPAQAGGGDADQPIANPQTPAGPVTGTPFGPEPARPLPDVELFRPPDDTAPIRPLSLRSIPGAPWASDRALADLDASSHEACGVTSEVAAATLAARQTGNLAWVEPSPQPAQGKGAGPEAGSDGATPFPAGSADPPEAPAQGTDAPTVVVDAWKDGDWRTFLAALACIGLPWRTQPDRAGQGEFAQGQTPDRAPTRGGRQARR